MFITLKCGQKNLVYIYTNIVIASRAGVYMLQSYSSSRETVDSLGDALFLPLLLKKTGFSNNNICIHDLLLFMFI